MPAAEQLPSSAGVSERAEAVVERGGGGGGGAGEEAGSVADSEEHSEAATEESTSQGPPEGRLWREEKHRAKIQEVNAISSD
jgi:hypothetical protein